MLVSTLFLWLIVSSFSALIANDLAVTVNVTVVKVPVIVGSPFLRVALSCLRRRFGAVNSPDNEPRDEPAVASICHGKELNNQPIH